MPVSAEPLNVQSGANVRGAWPPTSTGHGGRRNGGQDALLRSFET